MVGSDDVDRLGHSVGVAIVDHADLCARREHDIRWVMVHGVIL
jgi:hypothetical protein